MPEWQQALSRALPAAVGGDVTSAAVGKYLRGLVGRAIGDWRLAHAVGSNGTPIRTNRGMLWVVRVVEPTPPNAIKIECPA